MMNGMVTIAGADGTAKVIRANIQAENGVAHAIDVVLSNGGEGDDNNTDDEATLYFSSNTSGQIGVFSASENGLMMMSSLGVMNADADGIFYDEDDDVLYQLDRTNNRINAYTNVSGNMDNGQTISPSFSSTSDFTNGREIAVSDNRIIVTQDADDGNGNTNKLYVYEVENNSITLSKTFNSPINLWGIHVEGDDLVCSRR